MEISRKRCRRTTMSSPRHDTDVRHSRADSRGSDSLARQALADHVELVERGESERQRALAAAAILDRDADPQQFGQMPLDRHDVWIAPDAVHRSEEHTSELQSLMRISYAVFCLQKKKDKYD